MKNRLLRLALLLAGAICFFLSFPPVEIAALAWLVPLFWLAAFRKLSAAWRFRLGFGAGYLAAALCLGWLWSLFGAAALVLWMVFALYFGIWGSATALTERLPSWAAVLWPAVAWCGIEFFRAELAPLRFSWLSLGYSQMNLPGSALAPLVGVYAITFVLVLWGSVQAQLLERLRWWPALGLSAVVLIACLPMREMATERIGDAVLVQTIDMADPSERELALEPAFKPDLIVWPEYSITQDPFEPAAAWFLDRMKRDAERTKGALIFGAIDRHTSPPNYFNTAYVLDSTGELIGRAAKNQPVQFMNDGQPAKDVAVVDISSASGIWRAGIGICYDGSYQTFSRRMAGRGAEMLIFPTMNLDVWGGSQHRQHQRMFQFRAMETGLPILVAANSGPTLAAGPDGVVRAELPFGEEAELRAPILAATPGRTLFTAGGWLMGPLCLALTLAGGFVRLFKGLASRRGGCESGGEHTTRNQGS